MIAIYARQSIDKKDSLSIETQIELCRRSMPQQVSYTVYADKGYSGKNTKRPDFSKMMREIEEEAIRSVIVYKLDRISRSLLDFVHMITVFEKHHVSFLSASEAFDTGTAYGKAMMGILMVFAQLERETIQARVKDNYEARGKKGYFLGGPAPYGFTLAKVTAPDGHRTSMYVQDEQKAQAVAQVYEMYASGAGLGEISQQLNHAGIKAAKGGRWDSSKISKMLANPAYVRADAGVYSFYQARGAQLASPISSFTGRCGCYLYGKRLSSERKYTDVKEHTLVLGLHEGIVDAAIWLKAQEKLSDNQQIGNTGKGTYSWLSGRIKCGYCGYSLVAKAAANKKKTLLYVTFLCSGKANYQACSGGKTKKTEEIEEILRKMIFQRIREMESTSYCTSEPAASTHKINELKLQILDIEKEIENFLSFIARGKGSEALFGIMTQKADGLAAQRDTLNALLEEERRRERDIHNDDIKKYLSGWEESSLEEKKSIVRELIHIIEVTDEVIKISWRV